MDYTIKRFDVLDASILEEMMIKFYTGPAVLHKIDKKNIQNTIAILGQGSPFTDAFIIKLREEVAGYVLLSFTYSNESGGQVVWIEEIYIDKKFRGKQLSKALLNHILREYHSASRFRMDVVSDNDVSMNLFTSFGFEKLDYIQYIKDKN